MDRDGFGLATLLDDILGYDAEAFLGLAPRFLRVLPSNSSSVRIESVQALNRKFQETVQHHTNPATGKGIIFELTQGRPIRAQQSSDGAILFLGLLALIHSPEPPKLLLIEEPEKGVYPKRLEEVIRLIRRLGEAPSGRVGSADHHDDPFPVPAQLVSSGRGDADGSGGRPGAAPSWLVR